MNPKILAFAQILAVVVPTVFSLTAIGVLAHWFVERTNRLSRRPSEPADDGRLQRLEHAVDAIALEMERLGEGQRFLTKLLMDRSADLNVLEPPAERGRIVTPH